MMCSNFLAFCCSLVALLAITTAPSSAAVVFEVGGAHGWHRPDLNHTQIYDQWASHRKFHVGDSISFVYKNDSVMEVEKWAYYHCDTTVPPISVSNDGNTTVNLDRAALYYFISGYSDHCKDGQRLHIEVFPLHPPSPSPYYLSNAESIPLSTPFNFFSLLFLAFYITFLY